MDRDKKKKRNKKKNAQKNGPESSGVGGNGDRDTDYSSSTSSVNLIGLAKEHDHLPSQVPEEANVCNNVSGRNVDLSQHSHLPPNGLREPVTIEAEKQNWLRREAVLEETIEQLQNENHSLIQKQATLEEMTKQLQNEVYTYKRKEASLETKLVELQAEKDSWIEKEAGLKESICKLLDGKADLGLKVASLEENIKSLESEKESWILKENTNKETVSSLNDDITRLKAQVVELEDSRKNLSQEKQQVADNLSDVQSQIQNLERSIAISRTSNETSEHKELKSELEGQQALVAKLISENAELVEKVHDLYAELDQLNATIQLSAAAGNDLDVETPDTVPVGDPIPGSSEGTPVSNESSEVTPLKAGKFGYDNADGQNAPAAPIFSKADESGEIEQFPSEQSEIVDLEMAEGGKTNESPPLPLSEAVPPPSADPLPLSDAPLIGAPFRLISFFARYVSGADLVNKKSADISS